MRSKLSALAGALMLIPVVSMAQTATRSTMNAYNNSNITANGRGAITGPIVNNMFGQIISNTGVLNDLNTWTQQNTFNGTLTYTGTGAAYSYSLQDSSTNHGVKFDIVANEGGVCNGNAANAAADTAALAKVAAMSPTAPTLITFPGVCIINWTAQLNFSNYISFQGINGGGIRLAAGSTLPGTGFFWFGGSSPVSITDMLFDANSATVGGNGSFLSFGIGIPLRLHNNHIINLTQPGTGLRYNAINGTSDSGYADYNTISFTTASNNQNQCFNLTNFGNWSQNDNAETNCGDIYSGMTDHIKIVRNTINGWGYGAGIATNVPATDTAIRDLLIANNQISNSLATHDITPYYLSGIDNNFYGAVITGNRIYNTCGVGVGIWGKSTVVGNLVVNSGTCNFSPARSSAFFATTGSAITNSGAGSYFGDNQAYGSSPMTYGLTDGGQTVLIGVNEFSGAPSGAYNITGSSTYVPPLSGTP